MKVLTLDNFEYKWKMETVLKANKSQLHKNAAVLIKNVFNTSSILEEIQIQVKKNKFLYLDFYLPLFQLAVEVDGGQHETYSNFMSKNPLNFIKQKINDKLKTEWCELNNITLIRLKHDEEPADWRSRLLCFGNDSKKQPTTG